MSQTTEPSADISQQIVSDLIKKLRHQFAKAATDQVVSLNEFVDVFGKVFVGVPDDKFKHIFVAFDEESTGTINWYQFLRSEHLSKVLLSIHNQSVNTEEQQPADKAPQPESLQEQKPSLPFVNSEGTDSDTELNGSALRMNSITIDDTEKHPFISQRMSFGTHRTSASMSVDNVHRLSNANSLVATSILSMQPRLSFDEEMGSLQQEVQEKQSQINKLKDYITFEALPQQKTINELKSELSMIHEREEEMANEIQQIETVNKSLRGQNEALTKQNQELEHQHSSLIAEHKSLKNICNDIQRAYDECLVSFNTEKRKREDLGAIIEDLHKLKDQYEAVNNTQSIKIETYKQDINDLREKLSILEYACQEMATENELLQNYASYVSNFSEDDENATSSAPRSRALSAVDEQAESSALAISQNKDNPFDAMPPLLPKHPSIAFNRSSTITSTNLDEITRRFSNASNHGTLLKRIRTLTSLNMNLEKLQLKAQDSTASSVAGFTPAVHHIADSSNNWMHLYDDTNNDSNSAPSTALSLEDTNSNISNMSNNIVGKSPNRRKKLRRISILSVGTSRQLTFNRSLMSGTLESLKQDQSQDDLYGDDNGTGYADQFNEEMGDDLDDDMADLEQLQDITEQLKKELQEEMEEKLEEQIKGKYELEILKKNSEHNEQLMMLNLEIDRLKSLNKKQSRQLKIMARGGGVIDNHMTSNMGIHHNDDVKTNEDQVMQKMEAEDEAFNEQQNEDDNDTDSDVAQKGFGMVHSGDDDDDDEDTENDESGDSQNNYVMVQEYDKNDEDERSALIGGKGNKKKRKKDKKDKKKKKKKKRVSYDDDEEQVKKAMVSSGFCCSSIFADIGKKQVDISEDEPLIVKNKHKKKKRRHKGGDDDKKKSKKKDKDQRDKKKKHNKHKHKKKDKQQLLLD